MARLREQLARESPALMASLARSWEIAQREWLSAINPSAGSYNSLPHFTNIEQQLDSLLLSAAESSAMTLRLSPLEIYLLLASVLFHDVGRVKGDKDHATTSAAMLAEHFAVLGIPTHELAASLSRIAIYHDPLREKDKEPKGTSDAEVKKNQRLASARHTLRTVRLEPYGTARELYVATLLALADHMDGSVRRAVPRYVTGDEEIGFKGAFRRLVSGTGYDAGTCTIKTALCGFDADIRLNDDCFNHKVRYEAFERVRGGQQENVPAVDTNPDPDPCPLFQHMINRTASGELAGNHSQALPSKMFRCCLKSTSSPDGPWTIVRKKDKTGLWPIDNALAIVLNDLHANQSFLRGVEADLREMGLPVDGWLIEFGSEVYDSAGNMTQEDRLNAATLRRVFEGMWGLRWRTLSTNLCSFELLADSLRMENVELVRLAASRVAGRSAGIVFAGTSGWKLNIDGSQRSGELPLDLANRLKSDITAAIQNPCQTATSTRTGHGGPTGARASESTDPVGGEKVN